MKLHDHGVYLVNGVPQTTAPAGMTEAEAKKRTIAYGILKAHNTNDSMQNCNMIDGVPNNTPIPPTPPELDAKPLDKVKEPKERRKGRALER